MCLNLEQIEKTRKKLLDLRARCVGNRVQLQEANTNPEIHSVKCQASNAKRNINSRL